MVDHPFLKECGDFQSNTEKPVQFELIEGKDGYWERRERGDWADMPKLWGPF